MPLLRSLATLVVLTAAPSWTAASLFVTDNSMRRMVSFSETGGCSTHEDRRTIMRAVLTSPSHQVRTTSSREIRDLMAACTRHNRLPFSDTRGFIFPGTKWCGPGNQAYSIDDLGSSSAEDKCCREHDQCPLFLRPGQCMENVCNPTPFTRSECKCDNQFMQCLKAVGSSTADTIGYIFFNIAKVKCFSENTRCQPNEITTCPMKDMPFYETPSSAFLNDILIEILRGIVRVKQSIFRFL